MPRTETGRRPGIETTDRDPNRGRKGKRDGSAVPFLVFDVTAWQGDQGIADLLLVHEIRLEKRARQDANALSYRGV
ncbi:hypothetical protein [Pseudoduganella buxea]|uniref:Uncharacterized protein n=1 Tax=Pseudoduganella buxea TaxID=1949069 RepID=A0A6I3T180_9BURK|nr:hypothetical protein [Pseudoduganella buxea]MTV54665.1 hypothetical protein [Pseudoduganella buxea]GGC19223.1 hypothetical protein GCM10011572_45860 [Pseudoduganella buxea]